MVILQLFFSLYIFFSDLLLLISPNISTFIIVTRMYVHQFERDIKRYPVAIHHLVG